MTALALASACWPAGGALAAARLAAVEYRFSGVCDACSAPAEVASLKLQNYASGDRVTLDNIVSLAVGSVEIFNQATVQRFYDANDLVATRRDELQEAELRLRLAQQDASTAKVEVDIHEIKVDISRSVLTLRQNELLIANANLTAIGQQLQATQTLLISLIGSGAAPAVIAQVQQQIVMLQLQQADAVLEVSNRTITVANAEEGLVKAQVALIEAKVDYEQARVEVSRKEFDRSYAEERLADAKLGVVPTMVSGVFGPDLPGGLDVSFVLNTRAFTTFAGGSYSNDIGRQIVSGTGGVWSLAAPAADAVPEPASWGMMILGFGIVGATVRRRRRLFIAAG